MAWEAAACITASAGEAAGVGRAWSSTFASMAIWTDPAGLAAETLTSVLSAGAAPVRILRAWVVSRRSRG